LRALRGCSQAIALCASFQDTTRIYLALEWMAGGSLATWVDKVGGLAESSVRYYTASVAIAIGALHSHGYAFPGLQLEHVLVDKNGHPKLSGLSRAVPLFRAGSLAQASEAGAPAAESGSEGESEGNEARSGRASNGSESRASRLSHPLAISREHIVPEDRPPEIVRGEAWTAASDWWSFGLMAHRMLGAAHPFGDSASMGALPAEAVNDILGDSICTLIYKPPKEASVQCASCLSALTCKQVRRSGRATALPTLTPHHRSFASLTVCAVLCRLARGPASALPCRPALNGRSHHRQLDERLGASPSDVADVLAHEWFQVGGEE
jgi:serine/threonine protein kinase